MILIIAEKPEVMRDIANAILTDRKVYSDYIAGKKDGEEYVVTSAFGHLLRLADPDYMDPAYKQWRLDDLPIFFEDWKKLPGQEDYKKKRLKAIGELVKKADTIISAGDPDDEGQLLIDELIQYFKFKGPVKRVFINDNMPDNIRKEFRGIKDNKEFEPMGKSANARQIADMCFGINETRLAAIRLGERGISIGRVQTPTLGLVVARDEQIENHISTGYYELIAHSDKKLPFKWTPNKKYLDDLGSKYPTDETYVKRLQDEIDDSMQEVTTTERRKTLHAPLPYNLTVLQSDMNRRYGYSLQKTLDITQSLRSKKAITYNRSDSQYLKEEHFADAPDLFGTILNGTLVKKYNMDFTIHSAAFNDANVTAHHGIIPQKNNIDLSTLTEPEKKVYLAIVDRYAMQFMPPEVRDVSTSVFTVNQDGYDQSFVYTAQKVVDPGYTKYFDKSISEEKEEDAGKAYIPEGTWVTTIHPVEMNRKETKPPARYTEGTLVKDMASIAKYVTDPKVKEILKRKDDGKKGEHGSIGTVATRSAIIETLIKRDFLEKDGKYIVSTERGRSFFKVLPKEITKADTTAWWWLIQESIQDGTETNVNAIAESVIEEFNKHKDTAYMEAGIRGSRETKEKASGIWNGKEIQFNKTWGTYTFSEREIEELLNGEEITISYIGKDGKANPLTGKLTEQTYKGKKFIGFEVNKKPLPSTHVEGVWKKQTVRIKRTWGDHTFTEQELEDLFAGKEISFQAESSKGKPYTATGKLAKQKFKGTSYVGFKLSTK